MTVDYSIGTLSFFDSMPGSWIAYTKSVGVTINNNSSGQTEDLGIGTYDLDLRQDVSAPNIRVPHGPIYQPPFAPSDIFVVGQARHGDIDIYRVALGDNHFDFTISGEAKATFLNEDGQFIRTIADGSFSRGSVPLSGTQNFTYVKIEAQDGTAGGGYTFFVDTAAPNISINETSPTTTTSPPDTTTGGHNVDTEGPIAQLPIVNVDPTDITNHILNGQNEDVISELQLLTTIASHPDLIEAFGTNTQHANLHFSIHGLRAALFDHKQYLENYPDLQNAFGDDPSLAAKHFIEFGYLEGRIWDQPLPNLNTDTEQLADIFVFDEDSGSTHLVARGGTDVHDISSKLQGRETIGVGDFNGDGIEDLMLRVSGTTRLELLDMNDGVASVSYFARAGSRWETTFSGDFDADQKTDVLWIDTDTGDSGTWTNISSNRKWTDFKKALDGETVIGIGDINGDGKDDILTRNENTAWISYHEVGSTGVTSTAIARAGRDWEVLDIVNLDADQAQEIVWQKPDGSASGIWDVSSYDRKWVPIEFSNPEERLVGLGNVDDDASIEMIIQNKAGRTISYAEYSSGDVDFQFVSRTGPGWEVGDVSDFNGDGTDDILFVQDQGGRAGYWKMNEGNQAGWVELDELGSVLGPNSIITDDTIG